MRIPDSVALAYDDELVLVEELRTIASNRLRIVAANNGWLFDDRIKSAESALSKLETGRTSLREMHDLYAAMLVVPTQKHVKAAIDAVLSSFNGKRRLAAALDASSFVYDDVHILASLRGKISPRAVSHPVILDRMFEIQIHTGVQYAWWRATHDELYKGSGPASRSWGAKRASGQARASLELLDGVLADFEAAARLQMDGAQQDDPGDELRSWLHHWPRSRRPEDEVRFVSTASTFVRLAAVQTSEITVLLESGDLAAYVRAPEITPIQVVLIACHRLGGDSIFTAFAQAGQRLLLTSEVLAVYPGFDQVGTDRRVSM